MENDQSIKPCSVYMKLDPSLSPDTLDPSEASKQDRFKEEMQYKGNFCATFFDSVDRFFLVQKMIGI